MRKLTISQHWHELRYHMVAGLFWYLISFVSLAGIRGTFAFLRSHLGTLAAVAIDIASICVVFGVVILCVRLWIGPKLEKQPAQALRKVQVYRENNETATYKRKVRIAIKNESEKALDVRNPVWIANGGAVSLELPPIMKMQPEKVKGGWLSNQWIPDEVVELHLPPGSAFQTWIGLHEPLNDRDFGRAQENKQFGTLSLTIDGYEDDLQIRI